VAYGIAALVVGGAVALAVSTVHDHLDPVFHPDYGVDPARSDVQPVVIAAVVVFVVALAMWLVAMAVMYSAAPAVLQEAVLGRRTTFGAVWRKAWSRFPAVLGTLAIQWGAMLGAVLLFMGLMVATVLAASHHDRPPVALLVLFILGFLALIPVGMWLWVRFGFAPAAAVLENQRPIEALRRSAHLVKDAWWRTFGILIVVGMISAVIGYFVQLPFTYGGIFAAMPLALSSDSAGSKVCAVVIIAVLYLIGTVISQFLSTTLPQLAAGLLYVDQRIRRENLAAALAEAAGVPSAGGW
jgi:MFS family permease